MSCRDEISVHENQRGALGHNSADATERKRRGVAERSERGVGCFRRDGNEQSAGGLRIEEQVLMLGRNAGGESDAVTDEGAIVLEPTGNMTFASRFERAGKIVEGRMIDLEGNRGDALRRIAQSHFARVAQQAEAGDVGDRVNRASCAVACSSISLQAAAAARFSVVIAETAAAQRFRPGAIFL